MLYNNNEKSMGFRSQKLAGPGRLITLEGIDGTGKTTQISSLASAIRKQDISVLELREPGGTAIGEAIRRILLDNRNTGMCSESEMLLFAAARAQLVREVIRPALAAGTWVVCDRFSDSTLAYQGTAGAPIWRSSRKSTTWRWAAAGRIGRFCWICRLMRLLSGWAGGRTRPTDWILRAGRL